MDKLLVDYRAYLVTDSTPAILGSKDICTVVKAAIDGGVGIVQYRDKTSSTRVLVETARKLHKITQAAGVPLLINDRIDVALAIGCEGVHIGQDDMDIPTARRLMGQNAIIGATVSSVEEAEEASSKGADYLGIGTVYATQTKKDTKSVIGPSGVRTILEAVASLNTRLPSVCIGGINASNAAAVMEESAAADGLRLSGVAVVSAIMGAQDPSAAARAVLEAVGGRPPVVPEAASTQGLKARVPGILEAVRDKKPLSHNMTNLVVQNFAANVALAVGASPIMANYGEEAADLSKLGGALVINMGTVTPEGIENYLEALRAYNAAGRPVVFDPVGAGATAVRRAAVQTILSAGALRVIKGNEGEIQAVSGAAGLAQQRGVDSSNTLSLDEKADLVAEVARRQTQEQNGKPCIVVMTGKVDLASDGTTTVEVRHGHEILGRVTGTGCCLGTFISATLAASSEEEGLAAVVAALVKYGYAAQLAATPGNGPGSFVPAFIDQLSWDCLPEVDRMQIRVRP